MYIVIETFPIQYAHIVLDEDGEPKLFLTLEEAEKEKSELHDGKIVELWNIQKINNKRNSLYRSYKQRVYTKRSHLDNAHIKNVWIQYIIILHW